MAQSIKHSLAKTLVVVTSPVLAMVCRVTKLAANWLSKRSAGVTPEVDLSEHTLRLPRHCYSTCVYMPTKEIQKGSLNLKGFLKRSLKPSRIYINSDCTNAIINVSFTVE